MITASSTPIAINYFQAKVGGDAAALQGIWKALVAMDKVARAANLPPVLDHAFIASHTAGFGALVGDIESSDWSAIETACGLACADIEEIAAPYAASSATIVCYGMGITQHLTGTANVQQITNLLLLKGNIGKPGAGVCPLRGHSNVQGDRTVGVTERPSKAFLDKMRDVFGFEPPRYRTFCGRKHRGDAGRHGQGCGLPRRQSGDSGIRSEGLLRRLPMASAFSACFQPCLSSSGGLKDRRPRTGVREALTRFSGSGVRTCMGGRLRKRVQRCEIAFNRAVESARW